MAVFRIQEHTPDVYPRKSRDFQLLCNVFDCVNSSVKYDIDSIVDILDTVQCNDRVLPLLQTKLGFFTDKHLTAEELRLVLISFMKIVKDKGSRIGIREAIEVFLKISNISRKSKISILNVDKSIDKTPDRSLVKTRLANTYIVEISIESDKIDTTILTEILRYVLPAGYKLKYSFYKSTENITQTVYSDTIHIVFIKKIDNDGIRVLTDNVGGSEINYSDMYEGEFGIHGVGTTSTVPSNIEVEDKSDYLESLEGFTLGEQESEE